MKTELGITENELGAYDDSSCKYSVWAGGKVVEKCGDFNNALLILDRHLQTAKDLRSIFRSG